MTIRQYDPDPRDLAGHLGLLNERIAETNAALAYGMRTSLMDPHDQQSGKTNLDVLMSELQALIAQSKFVAELLEDMTAPEICVKEPKLQDVVRNYPDCSYPSRQHHHHHEHHHGHSHCTACSKPHSYCTCSKGYTHAHWNGYTFNGTRW